MDKFIAVLFHAGAQGNDHISVVDGVAQRIDTRNRGHDNDVVTLRQGTGGRVTEFVYLVVYGRVFFDIGVGAGDISLRLIVVVVGNKILNRILREEFTELTAKLCGEGFIVSENEGWTVDLGYNIGHGKGLTTTRNT